MQRNPSSRRPPVHQRPLPKGRGKNVVPQSRKAAKREMLKRAAKGR
jgi:hypothetical protein